jgi:hypothetical protein
MSQKRTRITPYDGTNIQQVGPFEVGVGSYYVGDLSFILTRDEWGELEDLREDKLKKKEICEGLFTLHNGRSVVIFDVHNGNGVYCDSNGLEYRVHEQNIGITSTKDIGEVESESEDDTPENMALAEENARVGMAKTQKRQMKRDCFEKRYGHMCQYIEFDVPMVTMSLFSETEGKFAPVSVIKFGDNVRFDSTNVFYYSGMCRRQTEQHKTEHRKEKAAILKQMLDSMDRDTNTYNANAKRDRDNFSSGFIARMFNNKK